MDDTNLFQSVTDWWSHPFNPSGSALMWILFLGFLIIVCYGWNLVLLEFREL